VASDVRSSLHYLAAQGCSQLPTACPRRSIDCKAGCYWSTARDAEQDDDGLRRCRAPPVGALGCATLALWLIG
jgi:hypothetical protein